MTHTEVVPAKSSLYKRVLPLAVLLAGVVTFFALGLDRYLTFDTLREHRHSLQTWVHTYGLVAALSFMALYAIATAMSLPGGAVLSITSGFLFGAVWGTVVIVMSATIGATTLFLITKTSFGDALRAKAGGWLDTMAAGFQKNALSYLLVLRLVPLFPFFIVNLVPALLGVPLRTYVIGTAIGIIPGSFVFASVGAGLGSLFDQGGTVSASGILTPQIITALLGLAVLAMIPVVYKKITTRVR